MTYRELLKDVDNKYYPDLEEAGGLPQALQRVFADFSEELSVGTVTSIRFIPYARVAEGNRSSQVYIAAGERLFLLDFWSQGVMFAKGSTDNLSYVAQAIYHWIKEDPSLDTMQERFKFFVPTQEGNAHEAGTIVEYQWQSLLIQWSKRSSDRFPSPKSLIEAAMQRPELRQLFPFTSLNLLCFSRTTGYPFTDDCPHAVSLGNGKYRAYYPKPDHKQEDFEIIGEGSLDDVVEMLIRHLPQDCGPAVSGTARDFTKR